MLTRAGQAGRGRICGGLFLAGCLWLALAGCDYTVEPLKGVEGRTLVYAAVGKLGAPNAGIVLSSDGAILIDPPLNPDLGNRLHADALRRSGVFWDQLYRTGTQRPPTQPPPVLYVINTTYRASHTFGNQSFLAKADFIATEKAGQHMANLAEVRKMRELLKTEFSVPGLENHISVPATLTFEGSLSLNTKEVQVKCVSMGDCLGEGDAVVFLPQQKILFAGDLVLVGYVPYPGGRTLTVLNWIKALKDLEGWDIEVVVPGHGAVGGKKLLLQQREFLETLVLEVRRLLKAGKPVEEAVKQVQLPNYAQWYNYKQWLGENVRLVYQELSKQGSADSSAAPVPASGAGGASMAGFKEVEKPDGYRDR